MDERVRQRLVGSVVLVALGVIFLPMLFDSPNEEWLGALDRPIPEVPPEIRGLETAIENPLPAPAPKRAPDATPEPATPSSPAAVSQAPRKSSADPRVASWAVQVGSFKSEQNALALRDRLRKQGFRAFVESLDEGGQRVTRVRVGPEIDQDRARGLRDRLKGEAKLDGIVVRHR